MEMQDIIVSHDNIKNHLDGVSTAIQKGKSRRSLDQMAVENQRY